MLFINVKPEFLQLTRSGHFLHTSLAVQIMSGPKYPKVVGECCDFSSDWLPSEYCVGYELVAEIGGGGFST